MSDANARLKGRLDRVYAALGRVRSKDVSGIKPVVTTTEHLRMIRVDARQGRTDADLEIEVASLIANIASLKDHLKTWCKENGVVFVGETLIDSDSDVGLIHDLWNVDKHDKLTKPPRSGVTPRLEEIEAWVESTAAPGGNAGMVLDSQTGALRMDGENELLVDAVVVDAATGKRIGDFLAIAERAINAWETTLRNAGVPVPAR